MKKPLKITLISLGSLVGLILLTIIIACWLVLTPARLTSIVRNQAPNFITCDFNIDRADLTIIKTFPNVGIKINNVVLMNPMDGSPSDTLASIEECVVSVDIKKLLSENHVIINECRLDGGYVNLFTNAQGVSNLDIFPPSTEPEESADTTSMMYDIDLTLLALNNVSVAYTDLTQGMAANLQGMKLSAKGNVRGESIVGDVDMFVNNLLYKQETDSVNMTVKLRDLKVGGDGNMEGDDIIADLNVATSTLFFESDDMSAQLSAIDFKYDGAVNDYDVVKGNAEISLDDIVFVMNGETYVDKDDVRVIMPLNATLSTMDIEFGASQLALNNIFINLIGKVAMPENGDIVADLDLNTNTISVEELIDLVPASLHEELLSNIDVKGELKLDAKVNGIYNDNSMPKVNANVSYNKGYVSMPEMLPYPVSNINTSLKLDVDLNNRSDVYVNSLRANMSNSSLSLSGKVNDVMDKMYCDLNLKVKAQLNELKPFVPEGMEVDGIVNLNVAAKFNNDQITNMDLMKTKIHGDIQWDDMYLVYADTINVNADKLDIDFVLPNIASQDLTNSLAAVTISGTNLDAKVSDMIVAGLKDYNIEAQVSNIMNETEPMSIYADFNLSRIDAGMEDMTFFANNPSGSVAMLSKPDSKDITYIAVYSGDSLSFEMGDDLSFITENLDVNVSADYDDDEEDLLLKWNPHAGVTLNNALLSMSDIAETVQIPSIDFKYDSTGVEINNSSIVLGKSDFELKGKFVNVDEFFRKEALLKGQLDFTSHYTDVNEIMEMFSGMGDTTAVEVESIAVVDTIKKEDNPFMVPHGVDITLNTNIEQAIAGDMNIRNVGGALTVKDGILVLNEMGFTSDAATMMVTAMYKSPRRNHLYLGLDLHLLEIDIAEMIDLIPELDTLVPMLSSFAGNAEFHFAAETYLKSNYDLKVSTLRGACAIHGKDLIVLDNATFRKIARMLNFKNKNHNKIDNLSVEITAFKNEIDVYPTLITLDKYQAIVGGRHNLDMTFDYRLGISNPWPFRRLGIKIGGNLDEMKYKFVLKRNIKLDDPKGKEKDVHLVEETMRLKSIISESLKDNIKK